MAEGVFIEKALVSKKNNHAVSRVNKETAKTKATGKSANKITAGKAAKKSAEKKAAKKAARSGAAGKKADNKQVTGKRSAKNKAEQKRVDKDDKKVKWKVGFTAKDAGQGGSKGDAGEPPVSVVQDPVTGDTFQETKMQDKQR